MSFGPEGQQSPHEFKKSPEGLPTPEQLAQVTEIFLVGTEAFSLKIDSNPEHPYHVDTTNSGQVRYIVENNKLIICFGVVDVAAEMKNLTKDDRDGMSMTRINTSGSIQTNYSNEGGSSLISGGSPVDPIEVTHYLDNNSKMNSFTTRIGEWKIVDADGNILIDQPAYHKIELLQQYNPIKPKEFYQVVVATEGASKRILEWNDTEKKIQASQRLIS